MAIKHWPATERPREKLLRYGASVLSDAELLAIFLRTGCQGKSAVDLARDLLSEFHGLRPLLEADKTRFCQAHGLGEAKFTQLQAVLEISRRHFSEALKRDNALNHLDDVKQFLIRKLRHQEREIFAALLLDNQHRLIAYKELFQGTVNCAHIHPREIVKCALQHNAAALILSHNHPSGDAEPSQADRHVTSDIKQALDILDIRVLDHVVVGDNIAVSFAERGWLSA